MKQLFKDISLSTKEVDEKGRVTFAISRYDFKDSDGDIVTRGAFKKTIKENKARIKHLKFHDTRLSPGTVKNIYDDGDYLVMESQLNLETEIGRDTYSEYKSGQATEHSIGYSVVRSSFSKENDANMLTEVKLWEGSTLLAWGANSQTPVLGIKSLEHDELEDFIKAMGVKSESVMVKCPECNLVFDYSSQKENTFETRLVDTVRSMVNNMAWEQAYQLVRSYEGDIAKYAEQVLRQAKSQKNLDSLLETAKYVNCPKCYERISKASHLSKSAPIITRTDGTPHLDFGKMAKALKND